MKAVILLCTILGCLGLGYAQDNPEWWKTMSLYQIYPRSFKDNDGDGVGDLQGIIEKLYHMRNSFVDAVWLSPIYPSPMVDFGYDISDFVGIDSTYGTMEDFEELVKTAHKMSLKVIMDFVPNHSSDQHEWFQKSLQNIKPYSDYYIWHKGKVLEDGTVTVPNNWVSVFGGPAWTWREERQAYYFHQFAPEQPDLNYNNEQVVKEMKEVVRFWLGKGIDGFRVDAVPHIGEDTRFLDEPLTGHTDDPNNYGYTEKIYTKDQPLTYEMVKQWREVMDEFMAKDGQARVMMIEAYSNISMTMKFYDYGAHFPFNFGFITDVHKDSTPADFERMIHKWLNNMPEGAVANWVAGNHDKARLATRFGTKHAKMVTAMTLLLPGVGVTYAGEEIGMENTWISWEDTKDPQGCNAGKEHYESASRDPERTPFQWDNTTSAGFSRNEKTWLPVNKNYLTLNLAKQIKEIDSYYTFYRVVAKLRSLNTIKTGTVELKVLNNNVLSFSRETKAEKHPSVYVVMNFGGKEETVDLSVFDNISSTLNIYHSTADPLRKTGTTVNDVKNVKIGASEILILLSVS